MRAAAAGACFAPHCLSACTPPAKPATTSTPAPRNTVPEGSRRDGRGSAAASSSARSPSNGDTRSNSSGGTFSCGASVVLRGVPVTVYGSLIMPKGLDGPELGRTVGRVAAEEQADRDGDAEGQRDRAGNDHRLDPHDLELAADHAHGHAEQPAQQAE